MSTIRVKGQEVKVGDDLWFLGKPHRITRIEDYVHSGCCPPGKPGRIAYSDQPDARRQGCLGDDPGMTNPAEPPATRSACG